MKPAEIMVRVLRGPITESIHSGHGAVVSNQGDLLYKWGDPHFVTYARSAAKLIQALPILESGAAEHFHLNDAEIALLCASHNGEEEHVRTAEAILAKLGLTSDQLQCGVHEPFHRPTALRMRQNQWAPSSLHNNCSGKHSGMLALAAHLKVSHADYLSIRHPVQQKMLQAVSRMSGVPAADIHTGIDGCGVPVFGMGVHQLALAYARLGQPEGLPEASVKACSRVIASIRNHPFHLAGSDRFDTELIKTTKGRIIGKMGAEGVFAITIPDTGAGIALKIEDGNQRALYPAVVEALRQLDLLSKSELESLAEFHQPTIRNWQGTEVGKLVPDFRPRRV